jgi:hypothetical protein
VCIGHSVCHLPVAEKVDFLVNRLDLVKEHIDRTESFIFIDLDHRRNELVALDIFVTALMAGFGFVSMVRHR